MPLIKSNQPHQYRAFGLNISCDWSMFQLPEHSFCQTDVDVTIIEKSITDPRFNLSEQGNHFQVRGQCALIKIPSVANFLISDGSLITVDINPKCDRQTINLYLLGSALGSIMHQRSILPLHGNSVSINSNAIIVAAHSGVGKSTLASEFYRRGYSLLSDDVCALDNNNHIHPSYPYLKLWQDAVDRLNIDATKITRITAQKEKFYVPLGTQFKASSLPLKSVYIVTRDGALSSPKIEPLKGLKKLVMLRPHIYRLEYLQKLKSGAPAMDIMMKKLNSTPIFHITRPAKGMHVQQIAGLILKNER